MKRSTGRLFSCTSAGTLSLALACGDLEIGHYPGAGGSANAGSLGIVALGGLPGELGAGGARAGASSLGGAMQRPSGAAGVDASAGTAAAGSSGYASEPSFGDGGDGGAGGANELGPIGGEKPDFLKQWEPHLGAPSPRVTCVGYGLPAAGYPVGVHYVGYDNGDVFQAFGPDPIWRRADLHTGPLSPPQDYSLPRLPVAALRQSPYDSQSTWVAFVGGAGRKLWRTANGSEWWLQSNEAPQIDVLSISLDPFTRGSYLTAVGLVDGAPYVYESLNAGTSWGSAAVLHDGFPMGQGRVSAIVGNGNQDEVWAGTDFGELFIAKGAVSADPALRVWTRIDAPDMPKRAITSVTLDPHDPLRAYVTFVGPLREGLWTTKDGGQHFGLALAQSLPEGTSAAGAVYNVSVHPYFSDVMYLMTTHGPFWSADRGLTWYLPQPD